MPRTRWPPASWKQIESEAWNCQVGGTGSAGGRRSPRPESARSRCRRLQTPTGPLIAAPLVTVQ